ncbi:MAG TPA: hypothetical protein VGT78_02900 [Rhizomicrobium sp.]|nr:hypothetical protein [Rhizomicrobium sp.]
MDQMAGQLISCSVIGVPSETLYSNNAACVSARTKFKRFRTSVRTIKHIGECYRALRDRVKLLAIVGILFALLNPKSRGMIVGGIGQMGGVASKVLPAVLGCLMQAAKGAQDNRPIPPVVRHL